MFTTRFVMLTDARTGSNALSGALHTHPAIYSDLEIFHSQRIFGHQLDHETPAERDADPFSFLIRHEANARSIKPAAYIYGFKLFLDHNDAIKNNLIADRSWKKVLLARKNTLDQFISLIIALKLKHWATHVAFDKTAKVEIDLDAFLDFHKHKSDSFENTRKALKKNNADWIDLDYADVAHGNFTPLLEFLGADANHSITPSIAKQNPPATADKLLNAAEVERFLDAHGLKHLWVG